MGRGGRTASKRSNDRHVRIKTLDSEDSDEDYVAEVDETDEQSDELVSLVGDDSSEDESFEEEEEEEDEEEEEWRTVVKPKVRKRPARSASTRAKRPKKRRKVTRDDEEDSDDDEEEFTPDEVEFLEEEDELPPPKKRTKKRRRTTLKRKGSTRRRRRKTTAKTGRKTLRERSRKTGGLKRKAKSGDDEEFMENGRTLRGRDKKKPVPRKRRSVAGSDSDFCSDPSDYEFTISEEEREQIREANEICRSLTTNLRSSRRIQEDEEALCEPRKPLIRKGKEKAVETKNDAGKPVCGICLTEEGKNTIRGTLNCCSHYFCFACIMEWSKVESRCPLCKQRFVTISKPQRGVKGFDLRDAVIQIPERDQVYQPSEEELRDFLNPYENVICTECHQGGDDALMLLCDLCDSPAHTYCVGLGWEVPEGNWYCDGCRPAALGSLQSQEQDRNSDQRTRAAASYGGSTYENMAEIDLNVSIPETPVSQGNGFLPSPRYSGGSFQAPSPVSGMGVSTVSGRRRIHNQIRVLLSNRLSQIPPGSDLDSLRSIFTSAFHESRTTDVGTSHHAQHVNRSLGIPNNVESREFFPGGLDHMAGQAGETSTSTGFANNSHTRPSVLERVNMRPSQAHMSTSESLRPCTSRLNVGLDIGVSPSLNHGEDHISVVKQEVHSIVNGQLKNLSRNLNLSQETYADISRKATDSIMVAYGREPRRHDVHQISALCCQHVSRLPNVEISPMNECCLTCFENFVKDVVQRLMNIALGPEPWWQLRYIGDRH